MKQSESRRRNGNKNAARLAGMQCLQIKGSRSERGVIQRDTEENSSRFVYRCVHSSLISVTSTSKLHNRNVPFYLCWECIWSSHPSIDLKIGTDKLSWCTKRKIGYLLIATTSRFYISGNWNKYLIHKLDQIFFW